MKIQQIELLRLRTPFKQSFSHSLSSRSHSDKIFVVVHTVEGTKGFGEVLAREYVSGESNDAVFSSSGPQLAQVLLGEHFPSLDKLTAFAGKAWESGAWGPALLGGFELALLNTFAQRQAIDTRALLGPQRTRPTGRCLTIGFECADTDIRRYVIRALLAEVSVVKLKLGLESDAERLAMLDKGLKGRAPIRLDANGCLSLERATEIISANSDANIQSLEQPFAADDPDLEAKLLELHERTGIPLMADESLCSHADMVRWLGNRCYQVFNIRVGKCGGLLATTRIRDAALTAGRAFVAGTMVGESAVLNHASELLLQHSNDLHYVEGLGQNIALLSLDPVKIRSLPADNPLGVQFEFDAVAQETQVIDRMHFS